MSFNAMVQYRLEFNFRLYLICKAWADMQPGPLFLTTDGHEPSGAWNPLFFPLMGTNETRMGIKVEDGWGDY